MRKSDWLLSFGAVGVAVTGFATSYDKVVKELRKAEFGALVHVAPIAVDLGILIASAGYITLERRDEAPAWLRWVPRVLTAATLYLNVASGTTTGKIAHAVLVSMWVVAVEVAAHVARLRARKNAGTAGTVRRESVPLARWIIAPVRTAALYRRMLLWDVPEYRRGLVYERARQYARGIVAVRYRRPAWYRRRPIPPLLRHELAVCEWPDTVTEALDAAARYSSPWKPAVLEWLDGYQAPAGTGTPEPPEPPEPERAPVPVPPVPAVPPHLVSVPRPRRPRRSGTASPVGTAVESAPVSVPPELVAAARQLDAAHIEQHGKRVSGDTAARELRVNKNKALAALRMARAS